MIRVDVDGVPDAQGSMSSMPYHRACPECARLGRWCGRARVCVQTSPTTGREIGSNIVQDADLKVWREMVYTQAKVALNRLGMMERPIVPTGEVTLGLVFRMPRPAGHFTTKGALSAEGERANEPWHKPDLDKLTRAILDSLGPIRQGKDKPPLPGQVYTDDAQVTRAVMGKDWNRRPWVSMKPGVVILIAAPSLSAGRGHGYEAMTRAVETLIPRQPVGDLFATRTPS